MYIPKHHLLYDDYFIQNSITVESKKHAILHCKYYIENIYTPSLNNLQTAWSNCVGFNSLKDTPYLFNKKLLAFFDKNAITPEIVPISLMEYLLEPKIENINNLLEHINDLLIEKNNDLVIITCVDLLFNKFDITYFQYFVQSIVYNKQNLNISFIYFYDELLKSNLNFVYRNTKII